MIPVDSATSNEQLLREVLLDIERAHDLSLDLDHYAGRQVLVSVADKIKCAIDPRPVAGSIHSENAKTLQAIINELREMLGLKYGESLKDAVQALSARQVMPAQSEQSLEAVSDASLFETEVEAHQLAYSLNEFHLAPSGAGPLAYTWKDKPHRLVYDLIAAVKYYATVALAHPQPAQSTAQASQEGGG